MLEEVQKEAPWTVKQLTQRGSRETKMDSLSVGRAMRVVREDGNR